MNKLAAIPRTPHVSGGPHKSPVTPQLCHSLYLIPCMLHFKTKEEKMKNEAFLPSEREEIQTLAGASILFSYAHNESRYFLVHSRRIQKCR